MVKICRKKSKRVPLKRRYNIEKKVKQHNKKLKKVARKEKQAKKLRKADAIAATAAKGPMAGSKSGTVAKSIKKVQA